MPITRPKQTQLVFSPLPASSPAKHSQPAAIRDRAAAVTISPSQKPRRGAKISDTFLPTPADSSQPDASMPRKTSRYVASSPPPERSSFMSRGRRTKGNIASSPIRESRIRLRRRMSSDSDDDEPVRSAKRSTLASSPVVVSSNDEQNSSDDNDDSDELPRLPTRKVRTGAALGSANPPDKGDESSSGDELPRLRRRKSELRQAQEPVDDLDEDEQEEAQPAKKRRRLQLPTTPRKRDRQEDLDLKADLEFLAPSSPEPETPGGTKRGLPSSQLRRNARQSALDTLKRRRQKNAKQSAPTSRNLHIVSDDSASGQASSEDEEGLDEESMDAAAAVDYVDEADDDFVVEGNDEDDAAVEIPFQFKLQVMKSKELFKYAVEWMCQKRLNPAFAIDDEIYKGTFDRLDDFVKGMGGSKFQSAAWTANFIRALKARPVITEQRFTNDGLHDRCDACNRSGHPPTWEVQLSGSPYDNDTLEEVDEDEDRESWRAVELPSSEVIYYLGKFCMANARTAHALAHWRYHLYQWVVDELEERGHLKPKKVLERDRWSTSKRREYANGVVDEMEEAGVIKNLYRDFKGQIETAQNEVQRGTYVSSP